ncbi:hypothetical protein BGZ59_008493 [Podila verticillata]|nr:hypothetical protein BGZ59_008493 [Podila verticillata]
MTISSRFITFFGATGGCTNAALVHTLNAGIQVRALARTPSKLTDMLLAQGISKSTIDSQLTIIKGDIASVPAIKSVLLSGDYALASQIMSGVGGTPQLRWSLKHPVTIDNPEICASTTENIVQALREIYLEHPSTAAHKPSIVIISTTGVSDVCEDVPFGFQTMYHVALADPHKDKKVMEKIITENAAGSDAVFRGAIAVRPSLLTGDQNIKGGKGWKSLRVGQEDKPAIGYTIHKADVGEWIFEETIKTDGQRWFGQKVTLTN